MTSLSAAELRSIVGHSLKFRQAAHNELSRRGQATTKYPTRSRNTKDDIYRSLGMVKVRGALGGTYYE